MRRLVTAILVLVGIAASHAAVAQGCIPSNAPYGSVGCLPPVISPSMGDYLYAWQPGQFPIASRLISVAQLGTLIGGGGPGSVSVGLSLPTSVFEVTGSPVTHTGTLTGAFLPQSANTFLRGPNSGAGGTPSFGPLVSADIPSVITQATTFSGGLTLFGLSSGTAANCLAQNTSSVVIQVACATGGDILTIGETTISGGTTPYLLYNNSGFLGNEAVSSLSIALSQITGIAASAATALSINVGSAGSMVVNGGALGTPVAGNLTNVVGLPLTSGVVGTLPTANGGTGATALGATVNNSGGVLNCTTATTSQLGCVEPDGSTITISGGVITSVGGGATGANPTATAGPTAINGSATTFMRSDAAPAVQKGSASQFGLVETDGSTISNASGVISCTTSTTSQLGCVKPDGSTITISSGIITSVGGATGANPTATAGPTAVNGSASTFMRSDGAPAVQKASSSQFGIVETDGSTITNASGVIACAISNTAQLGCVKPDGATITINGSGVISSAGGSATSITPGTTTIGGATAPCFIENSTGTTMACPSAAATYQAIQPAVNVTTSSSVTATASTGLVVFEPASCSTETLTNSGSYNGQLVTAKDGNGKWSTCPMTFTPASGTVDGQSSITVNQNYASVSFQFDGTNWWVAQ